MAEWTIRKAVAHDAIPLERRIDGAYARYRDRIPDLPSVSEGVPDDIRSNLVWVAEVDNKVVGGLILVLNDEHAILANIAVDPDYKGMGIGRGLINQAEVHCRSLKKAELRLSTHIDMPENVCLYKHLGWNQIESSGNKVRMTKLL